MMTVRKQSTLRPQTGETARAGGVLLFGFLSQRVAEFGTDAVGERFQTADDLRMAVGDIRPFAQVPVEVEELLAGCDVLVRSRLAVLAGRLAFHRPIGPRE